MTPSVRGRERAVVAALLMVAGGVAGAVAGLALGLVAALLPLPRAGGTGVAALALAAVAADLAGVRPVAVRRQVPWAWSRVFGLRTVAVLYGARLGVGPLTILNTWLWWAAALAGAWMGPAASAAVGASFAVARLAVVVAVGERVRALHGAAARARAVALAGALAGCLVVLAACTPDLDEPAVVATSEPRPSAALEPTGTTGPPQPVPPSTATAPAESSPLAAEVVVEGPPSFRVDGQGPLDLDEAASLEPDTAGERDRLARFGFEEGFSRSWAGPGERRAVVTLYRFASEAGAHGYLDEGVARLEDEGVAFFDVSGVDGAIGFRTGTGSAGAAFVREERVFLFAAGGGDADAAVDAVRALARAQAALR